ncbi:MAG TPA: secretin N-terminal domain-containing protein, partial [Candidatus Acidoferrum sp.]|nr:secretin N-terminal domain-containing protein [Candidatus Acidoferrum sp.]
MKFCFDTKRFFRKFCLLVIALLALPASTLLGQEQQKQDTVTMNMPDLDVRSLIQWAVDTLGKNIIVHHSVQGNVTILAGGALTKDEAWEVFLSAMQLSGYVVVENGNVARIIPAAEGVQTNIPLVEKKANAASSEMIIKLVKVKNIAASQLVALLRPLVPQIGYLAFYEQSNTLIIADYANNLSRIENIIASIDQAGTLDIEMIKLKHASAGQVINTLSTLMASEGSGTANPSG